MTETHSNEQYHHQVRVRWVDTDASLRIHYTAMFRFFEAAETEFMRSLGFTGERFQEMGVDRPRVNVSCDFKTQIRHDELLDISVQVARIGNTSVTLGFTATREDGAVGASGSVTFVTISPTDGVPFPVPPELRQALQGTVTTG